MPTAGKGLDLARTFYTDVVGPMITVPHAACLIGEGSEVLGYDTERSTDHEWGLRVQIMVDARDVDATGQLLDTKLPDHHRGYPTRWFSLSTGGISHQIDVDTVEGWLTRHLPAIPVSDSDTATWLAAPQQHLLQLTSGAVFHDGPGELTRVRRTYEWYPLDIWRWIVASQWQLIGTVEPLLGRTIEAEDQRGARLLIGRLCRLIMAMGYLQERRYQPYGKWFGRGFAELAISGTLGPLIDAALARPPNMAPDGPLKKALLLLGEGHNALGFSRPVRPVIEDFAVNVNSAVRPYPVLNTAAFIDATIESISDTALRNLPRVGAIDQLTNAEDLMINFTTWPRSIATTFRAMLRLADHDVDHRDDDRTQG